MRLNCKNNIMFSIYNNSIECVNLLTYLGSILTENDGAYVLSRVEKAYQAFNSNVISSVLWLWNLCNKDIKQTPPELN